MHRRKMRHLSILSVVIGTMFWVPTAWPQIADRYQLREDFRLGFSLSHVIKTTEQLPPRTPYYQLTLQQQALTRSWYSGMREVDAPPYPQSGVGIYNAVIQRHARELGVSGELGLEITVDAQGSTISTRVIRAPNETIAKLAVIGVKKLKFTPALCESAPCSMSFPIGVFLIGN